MRKSCLKYPVEFIEDIFGETPKTAEILKTVTGAENPRILLVADMNVVQRTDGLGTKIGRYVQANGLVLAGSPVVIAGGEKIKLDGGVSAMRVVDAALQTCLGKNDCLLAIGGGTLLDIAGYAAAQVRGGVPVVRLPTTPAAMVDAAFAEWAALDTLDVKDALRVPSVPAAVLIDVLFAKSVLDGVWRSGMGEAVRLAAASDASYAKKLAELVEPYRNRDIEALRSVVEGAVAVRAKKGANDFAAWAAARLEPMSAYKLPHGYAVPLSLAVELGYSVEKGLLKPADAELLRGILSGCGALDGLAHSQHLLGQTASVLAGLDEHRMETGLETITCLAGLGKTVEDVPDRAAYEKTLKGLQTVPKSA